MQKEPKKKLDILRLDENYIHFIHDIKNRLQAAQARARLVVNAELVKFYWELGKELLEKQTAYEWGDKFLEHFSQDMRQAFPEMQGFSKRNLEHLQSKNIPRLLNFFSASLISLYYQNPFLLLHSLLTELNNSASHAIIACWDPAWFLIAEPNQLIKIWGASILIYLGSYQFSHFLVSLLENAYTNTQIHHTFLRLMCSRGEEHVHQESITLDPVNWYSSNFWLSRKQTTRLLWQNKYNLAFFSMRCELEEQTTHNIVSVTCEALPQQFLALRN